MITYNVNLDEKKPIQIVKEVLFDAVLKIHQIAKIKCPVDTGRLRNSIKFSPLNFGATQYKIYASTDYAGFVEYGTFKQKAQPYMRPALKEVKDLHIIKLWKKAT